MSGYDEFFKKVGKETPARPIKKAKPRVPKKKNRKKEKGGSIVTGLLLATGLVLSYAALEYSDDIMAFLDNLEVSAVSKGLAKQGKKSPDKKLDEAKKSTMQKDGQKSDPTSTSKGKKKKANYDSYLVDRKQELDQREDRIKELENELQRKKGVIEEKLAELEKMRRNISSILKDRVEVDKSNVERLVDFYSNMKPQKAAKVINELDPGLAVTVLSHMKKQNAASIMNFLPINKAKYLTESLAGVQ